MCSRAITAQFSHFTVTCQQRTIANNRQSQHTFRRYYVTKNVNAALKMWRSWVINVAALKFWHIQIIPYAWWKFHLNDWNFKPLSGEGRGPFPFTTCCFPRHNFAEGLATRALFPKHCETTWYETQFSSTSVMSVITWAPKPGLLCQQLF